MVTRWEQGRPVLDRLIAEGRLDRVVANPTLAGQYLAQAHSDSDSARMLLPITPWRRLLSLMTLGASRWHLS